MSVRNRTLLALLLPLWGCTALGDFDVNVQGGNQAKGTITRPLSLTLADDETVVKTAQRICDRVSPGSEAEVFFLGKTPGPGPIDLADWGKYSYECAPFEPAHAATPPQRQAAATAAAPASAVAAPSPASSTAPPTSPPPASAAPALPAASAAAADPGEDARRRQCLRQQGAYDVCLGGCLLTSDRPTPVVAAECEQGCRAKAADCK